MANRLDCFSFIGAVKTLRQNFRNLKDGMGGIVSRSDGSIAVGMSAVAFRSKKARSLTFLKGLYKYFT